MNELIALVRAKLAEDTGVRVVDDVCAPKEWMLAQSPRLMRNLNPYLFGSLLLRIWRWFRSKIPFWIVFKGVIQLIPAPMSEFAGFKVIQIPGF